MKTASVVKTNSALKKTRAIKDCATGNWSYEFEFVQPDGTRGHALVPGDHANVPASLIQHLNRKGATLPNEREARRKIIEGLIASKVSRFVHQVANAGWQLRKGETLWMSFGNRMVGAPVGKIVYAPPQLIARSRAKWFAARGSLDEWRARIAGKAALSTCLTLSISAAFAAPLVRASGLQNFTLHVSGKTRAGKSTTLLCAMSVFGIGHEERLKNWSSSGAVELLEAAAGFNDVIFPLNEVGAAKGKRDGTYQILRNLYARYAEGGDQDRHSAWEASHGGQAKQFRGICISTAEHSVAEYASKALETRDGGELFRAIDVIPLRDGMKTVLDLAPETLDQRKCLQALRDDLMVCHGTAFPVYVEYLIGMGQGPVKRRVLELINEFVGHMPEAAHDGVARQMAMNFGLLYAGASLGIDSGVLPWTKAHLRQALTRSFRDAFEHSGAVDPLELGLEILKANLRDKVVEREANSTFGVKAQPGFWRLVGGQKIYVVHTRQFGAWFSGKPQRNLVLDWLAAQGHLRTGSPEAKGVATPNDLKGVFRRWPDSSPVRSLEFSNPFPDSASSGVREKAPTRRSSLPPVIDGQT